MSVYAFADPSQVFFSLDGTRPASGGKWYFYELGTTTLKDTFQQYDLDPDSANTNPIVLDSSGRIDVPVWLEGDYTVRFEDADGSTITANMEVRAPVSPGLAIPSLVGNQGRVLSNDGSILTWWDILMLLLPDPTGSGGMMPVVAPDGSGYILQNQPEPPEIPEPDIVVTATKTVITDTNDNKIQFIRGTGVSSGGVGSKQTTATVNYETPFNTSVIPSVSLTGGPFATGNGVTGYYADIAVSSYSAAGFTVTINTNHGESNSDGNISGNISFGFQVWGPVD